MDDSISLRLGTIVTLNNIGIAFLQRLRYTDAIDALGVVSTLIAAELVQGPTEEEPIMKAMEILSREIPALRNVEKNKYERNIKITAVSEHDAKKVIRTNKSDLMRKNEAKPILLEMNSTKDDEVMYPLHAKFGAVIHNLAMARGCKMIAELGFVRDDLTHIDYNMTFLFDLSNLMLTEPNMDPMAQSMYFQSIKSQPEQYAPGASTRKTMMGSRRTHSRTLSKEDIGPGGLRIPAKMQKMQSFRLPSRSKSNLSQDSLGSDGGRGKTKMISRTKSSSSQDSLGSLGGSGMSKNREIDELKEEQPEHDKVPDMKERPKLQERPRLTTRPSARLGKMHSLRNLFVKN